VDELNGGMRENGDLRAAFGFALVPGQQRRSRNVIRRFLPGVLVAVSYLSTVHTQSATDAQELYRARRWFELREALTPASRPLLRAAVANAFNDRETAERLLLEIVKSRPRAEFANDAFDMLCQLYARTGQYARFLSTYRD